MKTRKEYAVYHLAGQKGDPMPIQIEAEFVMKKRCVTEQEPPASVPVVRGGRWRRGERNEREVIAETDRERWQKIGDRSISKPLETAGRKAKGATVYHLDYASPAA